MPPSIKLEYFFLISWVISVGRIMQAFNCVTQLNYPRNYLYSVANLDCSIPSFRRIKTGSISEDEDTIDFLLSTASPGEEKIGGKVQNPVPQTESLRLSTPPPHPTPPPPAAPINPLVATAAAKVSYPASSIPHLGMLPLLRNCCAACRLLLLFDLWSGSGSQK